MLYVKTANTFAPAGAAVPVTGEVELGATLGLVIGDFETNGGAAGTHQAQAAIVLKSMHHRVPRGRLRAAGRPGPAHASYYAAIRYPATAMASWSAPHRSRRCAVAVKALKIEVRVNGARKVQTVDLSTLVHDAATLLADVGAFMTLQPGDVLLLGADCLPDGTRPRARAGDRIEMAAPGLAPLTHTLVEEMSAADRQGAKAPRGAAQGHASAERGGLVIMKPRPHRAGRRRARRSSATGQLEQLRRVRGRRLSFDDVVWLPPLAPTARTARTVLALGLNYADHAKELAFQAARGAAGLRQGRGLADRPSRLHRAPRRRAQHTTNASWRWSSSARPGA